MTKVIVAVLISALLHGVDEGHAVLDAIHSVQDGSKFGFISATNNSGDSIEVIDAIRVRCKFVDQQGRIVDVKIDSRAKSWENDAPKKVVIRPNQSIKIQVTSYIIGENSYKYADLLHIMKVSNIQLHSFVPEGSPSLSFYCGGIVKNLP